MPVMTGPKNLDSQPNVGGKLMVPSDALTPRFVFTLTALLFTHLSSSNLFAIDYVKEHPGTTVNQFKEMWKRVEKENNKILKVSISMVHLMRLNSYNHSI